MLSGEVYTGRDSLGSKAWGCWDVLGKRVLMLADSTSRSASSLPITVPMKVSLIVESFVACWAFELAVRSRNVTAKMLVQIFLGVKCFLWTARMLTCISNKFARQPFHDLII